jgi:predicted TPR repeat methyltransferase
MKHFEEIMEANIQQVGSEVDNFTIERYNLFVKHITKRAPAILDFGCNTGRGGAILRNSIDQLTLIGSDILTDRLKRIPPSTYDRIIDLSKEKLENCNLSNIDAIVSGEVVEHIPFNDLVEYIKLFYGMLNDDGLLMLTTPNPNALLVKLGRKAVLHEPSHVNIMEAEVLRQLILDSGFSTVQILGSGKATRYFGEGFPLWVYGSYLIIASK